MSKHRNSPQDNGASRVRRDAASIRQVLDELDASSADAAASSARASQRHAYRVTSLEIELSRPRGGWDTHVAVTRNLSREGLGCLMGLVAFPGTKCRVLLRTVHNYVHRLSGRIVRCRYLWGSGNLYEVGVRFDAPVDLPVFVRNAIEKRMLVADADPNMHGVMSHFLAALQSQVTTVTTGPQALQAATEQRFDIIFLEVDLPEMDGAAVAQNLREHGHLLPIVAMTTRTDEETAKRCVAAGFSATLIKPLSRQRVEEVVTSLQQDPIVSALVHDRTMAAMIDQFVAGLPKLVSEIEQAYTARDYASLEARVRLLRGAAGTHGFDMISAAAQPLESVGTEHADIAQVRERVSLLCRLCMAARPVNPAPALI